MDLTSVFYREKAKRWKNLKMQDFVRKLSKNESFIALVK